MRVFLDANVLISAFSPGTVSNRLLEFVLTRHDLVLGLCVLNETRRILVEKFGANKLLVEIFLDGLLTYAVRVEPIPPVAISRGLRDPDDEVVLASAILGLAEVLVTRDKDLLEEATRFAGEIIIRSPAAFIESYKANA